MVVAGWIPVAVRSVFQILHWMLNIPPSCGLLGHSAHYQKLIYKWGEKIDRYFSFASFYIKQKEQTLKINRQNMTAIISIWVWHSNNTSRLYGNLQQRAFSVSLLMYIEMKICEMKFNRQNNYDYHLCFCLKKLTWCWGLECHHCLAICML